LSINESHLGCGTSDERCFSWSKVEELKARIERGDEGLDVHDLIEIPTSYIKHKAAIQLMTVTLDSVKEV